MGAPTGIRELAGTAGKTPAKAAGRVLRWLYISKEVWGPKRGTLMTMRPDSKKPRALVVEDEASIRNGLCDVLVYRGFEVESMADGASALTVLVDGHFD